MVNNSKLLETNDDKFIEGKKAFEDGKYVEALEILLLSANENNADAEAIVGLIFFLGLTENRNLKKAIFWLEKAAENGCGDAAHNLSTLYITCEPEMPIDTSKSKFWLHRARELGFEVAPKEWYESIFESPK